MPSNLSSPRTDVRQANLQKATQLQYLQTLSARGPFLGVVPDIDGNQLPAGAAQYVRNLRARATPGGMGEVLSLPPGHIQVQPVAESAAANRVDLPLGYTPGNPIIMLGQLDRTNTSGARTDEFDITPLALAAGDGVPDVGGVTNANLYRLSPASGDWELVTYQNGIAANFAMGVDRDNNTGSSLGLPHMCTFAPGVPTVGGVTRQALLGGAINQPVAIICTDLDRVMVYPPADAVHLEYDDLTDIAALEPFKAKSCASWNDRVYFLNTNETTVRYPQRIRRTANGTANPDPAILGSGVTDVSEFSRDGLRLEPIGDVLAAYFEDGVAFLQRTQVATSPEEIFIVTKQRGLLGTHAVCPIGGNEHFGIFNDGWFILNSNGEWHEVGMTAVGDIPRRKWSSYFYQQLDYDNRHRLFCYYIRDFNQVAIVVPVTGMDAQDTTQVWFLDLRSERVFIDDFNATVLGGFDLQILEDVAYADFEGAGGPGVTTPDGDAYETYADLLPTGTVAVTYASIGPRFAMEGLVHGTTDGYVYAHDTRLTTRNGVAVTWTWRTPARSAGATRFTLTADRIAVEYIRQGGVTGECRVVSGTSGTGQSHNLNFNEGLVGTIQSTRRYFRFAAASMGVEFTGTGPIMLRSFDFDYFGPMVESLREDV